jgi:pSer/pThr/pTyr-binding forkhead associated (FHA) protein
MRYVPGELVVLSGEDRGKSFKIAGYPTSEGSVVTIGREPVTDERAFAHIQIEERFHTVSRKQAELIWKEKKLFVRNLSDTNPTQVNGIEIKPGKKVQLKPGAVMRTGELEFEYKV